MGDHDHGVAKPRVDLHHRVLQMRAGQRVQRAEGFVQQQDLGLHRQGAGDADPLTHPARDLGRALVGGMAHLDQVQVLHDPVVAFRAGLRAAEDLGHGQLDVVIDRQPGQQAVVLEDHGPVGARRVDLAPVQGDRAAGHVGQTGDQVQQGRLAAAGMADDADEFALVDRQGDVGQHMRRPGPVHKGFGQVFDGQVFHGHSPYAAVPRETTRPIQPTRRSRMKPVPPI